MRTHVTVLAWLYLLMSGFHVLIGLLLLLMFIGIGAFASIAGGFAALPILGALGSFLFLFFLFIYGPGLLVGIGLLSYAPWARILGIVLSILQLLYFPFGTLLGAYGLFVLFNEETARLFEGSHSY